MPTASDPPPRLDPLVVGGIVGTTTFRRAQGYQRAGMVTSWRWDADELLLSARVAGSGAQPYGCRIWFVVDDAGRYAFHDSSCSCPVAVDCKHVAATLLHVRPHGQEGPSGTDDTDWRGRLAAVTGVIEPTAVPASGGVLPVALRFRLDGALGDVAPGLSVRPVVPSRNGGWKTAPEASWDALTRGLYAFAGVRATPAPEVRRWFADLGATCEASAARSRDAWRPLGAGGRGLWALLAEAGDLGVPFVGHGVRDEVHLARTATVRLEVGASTDGVRLAPVVAHDGSDAAAEAQLGTVGDTGLYAVESHDGGTVLRLGPTSRRLGAGARELVSLGPTDVPASDVDEFFTEHLPALRRAARVVSDGSVELPENPRPLLVATARFDSPERADLTWSWRYPRGERDSRTVPLTGGALDPARDPEVEAEIREKAASVVRGIAGFERFELDDHQRFTGLDALDLAQDVLPALAAAQVRVEGDPAPDYHHLDGPARVVVDGAPSGRSDWLDLGISVTVAGKEVPFTKLFTALAHGRKRLLLVDGSWLGLNQPSLGRLRSLIEEATALSDRPGRLSLSRYDAQLWGELEDAADEVRVSDRWRRSVADLRRIADGGGTPVPLEAPEGLHADLRPYQHQAYEWLSYLWQHGLGGILADDMGLGKTVETLAFLVRARAESSVGGRTAPPFVVVAPASVVGNWVDEAARFTPEMAVVALPATTKKLGRSLADLAAGADVVVTSYAVYRLEFEAFDALEWSGLILDEAQFAKNPRTRANQTARRLDAPFKLAITGTPLENNLTELWAMLAIVAPGLYPSLHRFRAETIRPVDAAAQDDDAAVVAAGNRALARLKRRIRVLMLRRTKSQVAPELPARQEQVLRVPLAPDHRRVYDTHLQRERQRLLGLLTDFEANRAAIFRSLTTLRRLALDAALVDDAYAGITSTKLDTIVDQLVEVAAEGHRALVFSQFTSFLRRVERRCAEAGLPVAYLDGSTRDRAGVIRGFKQGSAPVFLISLKAGGVGLNLTEADYVYLLDPWWNPAAEAQAIDRTHRIGQTRRVVVTRMVAADTIEEKVMALAQRKAALFDAVLDDDAGAFAGALAAEDVRGLLDG